MTRTRSEYRVSVVPVEAPPAALDASHPIDSQREVLATLLLDHYLADIERPHSYVVLDGNIVIAFSFVVKLDGLHYIDPAVVAPAWRRRGLGRATVGLSLASLARAGIPEAGATITDGNIASERLFLGLGFSRHGAWA